MLSFIANFNQKINLNMAKNISEICSINFHTNHINFTKIVSKKCPNKSHLYSGNSFYRSVMPCYNCNSIFGIFFRNQKKNKCVLCHKMTLGKISLKNNCNSCKTPKRYYMCGMCSNIIGRCTDGCKNNNEIICNSNIKYLLCETCEQK